jgi:Putative metallopeptidase
MEDAADSFATLTLIRVGSDFSHGVLTAAEKGWFLADPRDRETGLKLAFYGEHGLSLQRAYEIVCLMVGSDEDKFKDMAEEIKLPEARQHTCLGDCSNAAFPGICSSNRIAILLISRRQSSTVFMGRPKAGRRSSNG